MSSLIIDLYEIFNWHLTIMIINFIVFMYVLTITTDGMDWTIAHTKLISICSLSFHSCVFNTLYYLITRFNVGKNLYQFRLNLNFIHYSISIVYLYVHRMDISIKWSDDMLIYGHARWDAVQAIYTKLIQKLYHANCHVIHI